jgi:hypothetical protein
LDVCAFAVWLEDARANRMHTSATKDLFVIGPH